MKGVINMLIEIEYTTPIDDEDLRQLGAKDYMCCDAFSFNGRYHKDRIDTIIRLIVRNLIPIDAVIERITVNND